MRAKAILGVGSLLKALVLGGGSDMAVSEGSDACSLVEALP